MLGARRTQLPARKSPKLPKQHSPASPRAGVGKMMIAERKMRGEKKQNVKKKNKLKKKSLFAGFKEFLLVLERCSNEPRL